MIFKLEFYSDGYGIKEIDIPIGFDSVDFQLKQDNNRLGRDVSFSGGETEFTFSNEREHEFEQLLYYHNTFGFESKVRLIIEFDGTNNIIGDLYFKEAKTDELTYFTCKIVQDSNQARIKRRLEIKTDLLSDKDLDDNTVIPLATENILLQSKPVFQESKWEQNETYSKVLDAIYDDIRATQWYAFNPAVQLNQYDLENSYTFFQDTENVLRKVGSGVPLPLKAFKVVTAKNNLQHIKINTSNFDFTITTDVDNGGNGYVTGGLYCYYGIDDATAKKITFFEYDLREHESFDYSGSFDVEIPYLDRGESIWFGFYQKVRQSADGAPGVQPRFESFPYISNFNFSISGESVAFNTVVPSFRLYDVMKTTVRNVAGLEIEAPKFQSGTELYKQRLLNGNFLRGLTDKPFYINMQDLLKGLIEYNADFEVTPYNYVFFGLYKEFYQNKEIGFLNKVQFDTLVKTFNERFCINQFSYKFNNYQSQKENSQENTFDVVHGESQWFVPNDLVDNKVEIEAKFIRDSFDIEFQRRKGYEENKSTATSDDDKYYEVDAIEITDDSERYFTETTTLLHSSDDATGYIKLQNDGSFNFALLGIAIGEQFIILSIENGGVYEVIDVTNNFVSLNPIGSFASLEGEFITTFKYYVSPATANYKLRLNEGFTLINNLRNGDNFANLAYTVSRNIYNYFSEFLSSCLLFTDKKIKNTFYKNNPDCLTVLNGSQIKEGDSFRYDNQILSAYVYENVTNICSFQEYKDFENKVRLERGYFRFVDNNMNVYKGYPKQMKFINLNKDIGEMTCDLEMKYDSKDMSITTPYSGIIIINDETRLSEINYKIISNKLFIFDFNMQPLYNGVYWNRISINNYKPTSIDELTNLLDLL